MDTPSSLSLASLADLAALLAGCATPAPSRLGPARWWTGSAFESGTRDIQSGHIVPPSPAISETVDLGGAYAVPALGECGTQLFAFDPSASPLTPGARANFWLLDADPRHASPRVLALICDGHLQAETP